METRNIESSVKWMGVIITGKITTLAELIYAQAKQQLLHTGGAVL